MARPTAILRILLLSLTSVTTTEAFRCNPVAAAIGTTSTGLVFRGRGPMALELTATRPAPNCYNSQPQQQQQQQRQGRIGRRRATASAAVPPSPEQGVLLAGQDGQQEGEDRSAVKTTPPPPITLGISPRVLERTIVVGLAGAVLKQSPSDFVVVELPLYGGTKFTPADPDKPLPDEVKSAPVRRQVPDQATVLKTTEEWRERWPTPTSQDGEHRPATDEQEQAAWDLGKGFDAVAHWLGGDTA